MADTKLVNRIMEMFPEICPTYLRTVCMGRTFSDIEDVISEILDAENYPKRIQLESPTQNLNFEEQLEWMKQVLPEADPDFLEMKCGELIDRPNDLREFINEAIEKANYPSMNEYLRKQQIVAQAKQYTTDFNIKKFLEVIPDPAEHFRELHRSNRGVKSLEEHYGSCFLRNRYRQVPVATIKECYHRLGSVLLACNELDRVQTLLKYKRPVFTMPSPTFLSIPFLQEIAYIEHYDEITQYIEEQQLKKVEERRQFKEDGLMETCGCCFDDEIMPTEIYCCQLGCKFCQDCIKQSVEIAFSENKLDFKCLSQCESHFSLETLQDVLSHKLFSRIASLKQAEEVKSAGIENLETCPFCHFAAIPAKGDKLFRCFNPECMKETSRLCKEPSHIPLRCEEIEQDADVKVRTFVENKMTEALLRKCWKCGVKFIKADGCNKMKCSCGAQMCYICQSPVVDYTHFNGPGGNRLHLCPLYSDTHELHEREVLESAQQAMQGIASTSRGGQLKVDPTTDVKKHYDELKRREHRPE